MIRMYFPKVFGALNNLLFVNFIVTYDEFFAQPAKDMLIRSFLPLNCLKFVQLKRT